MAHYFDVISCGIKQMHAQFSLLLDSTPGRGGGVTLGIFGWGCAAGTLEPFSL